MTKCKLFFNTLLILLLTALSINPATAAFDPATELKVIASDGAAGDYLGFSVSIDGSRMAVGAYNDDGIQGAVYIYDFDGSSWNETVKLTASDASGGAFFGRSVHLKGDRLVIGARGDNGRQGAVYVFDLSGGTWTETVKLVASDGASYDYFGSSVFLDGNRMAVGAWGDESRQGSVYIFDLSGSTWSETAKLVAGDGTAGDLFGYSVSLSGSRLAIGSGRDDSNQGSAYVFDFSGGTWSETAKLTASDGAAENFFGWSVSLDGDRLAVGAYNNNIQGAVYVFDFSGGTWNETKLTASDAANSDWFGGTVFLVGDRLVVGAAGDETFQGSVYVFDLSAGTWTETTKLTASDPATWSFFGRSVSLSGNRLAVGSSRANIGANSDQGAVYVYTDTATYTIGGTISGLSGTIVLQNNGGDDLTITADGPFTFPTGLLNGAAYNITILNPPAGQSCTISNGSGTVSGGNIGNIQISCRATTVAPVPTINAYGILLMLLAMLGVAWFGVRRS